MTTHSNGFYTVKGNMLTTHEGLLWTDKPAFVIDAQAGTLLKVAPKDAARAYYDIAVHQFGKVSPDMVPHIAYVAYDPDGDFSLDEFCTLVNMLHNTLPPETVQQLLDPQQAEQALLRIRSFEPFDF